MTLISSTVRVFIVVAAIVSFTIPGRSEQAAVTKETDLNCSTSYQPAASVTSLSTGLGIGALGYDMASDKVPPCTGTLPTQPPLSSEYPLNGAIPQLVKVLTNSGQCSGNLIAQNAVITAGHCVFDQTTKKFATNVQIVPGYQNGQRPYNTYDGATVLTFRGYTASNIAAHDIAVIKFVPGEGFPQIYGYYGLTAYDVANCNKPKGYTEPHYSPNVSNNEAQAGADGTIGGCVQGTVVTTLPLLLIDRFSRTIFAVHSQYSLTPAASYDAVLTRAKICAITAFLADTTNGTVADCAAGD